MKNTVPGLLNSLESALPKLLDFLGGLLPDLFDYIKDSILPEVLGICEFVLDNLSEILDYNPSLPEFLESTMTEFLDSLNTLVSELIGYPQALLDFVDESIPEPLGNPSCSGEAIETEACEVPTCSGFPQPPAPANCSECAGESPDFGQHGERPGPGRHVWLLATLELLEHLRPNVWWTSGRPQQGASLSI